MGRTIETGHAVNLSNCKLLIDTCIGFGANYNPDNTGLTIAAMMAKWVTGTTGQKAYITALERIRQPVNTRKKLFVSIIPLATRVLGELNSTHANAQSKAGVKTIADDIHGNMIPVVKKNRDNTITIAISQSHAGYVQRANNFFKLIELLKAIPEYSPKKDFIKIPALTAVHAGMEAANNNIGALLNAANAAMQQRNHILYTPGTGIVDTALSCKQYVKELYGCSSAEYKMITKINFRNLA